VLVGADGVAAHRYARHAVRRRREHGARGIRPDGKPLHFYRPVQAVVADSDRRDEANTNSIRTGPFDRKLAITSLIRSIA
jgi:hypothetical protein